jgi:hypothetical protein
MKSNMHQSTGGSSSVDRFTRHLPTVLTTLAVLAVAARLWLAFRRLYDPDELQHLHAGFCLWRGVLPYRDFFEQHQPVLWYVSLALFAIWGESLDVVFAGRFLIWIAGAVTAGMTWKLGNRLFGRYAGPVALLLLLAHPPYQEKNVEWRPDNMALPLVLAAIWCLDRTTGSHQKTWACLAGACSAAAFFCTQKVVYVESGIFAAVMWCRFPVPQASHMQNSPDEGATASARGLIIPLISGAILVGAVVLGALYLQGILTSYLDMTLLAPMRWQTRESVLRYVITQIAPGSILYGLGLAGWMLIIPDLLSRRIRSVGAAAVAGGTITHLAGVLHVPAAFHQYFLPVIPLVALMAAHAWTTVADLADSSSSPVPIARMAAVMVGLCVAITGLFVRSLDTLLWGGMIAIIAVMLVASALLILCTFRRAGALLVLAASMIGTLEYHRAQFGWSHEHQSGLIRQLMNATEPQDAFLDGFTGYGALRPHAFYVFWLNQHSWPMIPADQQVSGIIGALEHPRTRIVLFDQYLARFLPAKVQQFIEQHYRVDPEYSDFPRLLVYVRNDRPLPPLTQPSSDSAASPGQ